MSNAAPWGDGWAEQWRDLGFDAGTAEWQASGLSPFQAAVARGAGWTPSGAQHQRRLLGKIQAGWTRAGFGPDEALGWHQAMFTPVEASRWRAAGFEVKAAGEQRTRGRTPVAAGGLREQSEPAAP
jgi:hypothetical protein